MWNEFGFNAPYIGKTITKINGVGLPQNYLDFMIEHNGGEGDIGESWLVLYSIEELKEINDDYNVPEYLPDHIIIGSNGGEEFFGINSDGKYFIVPSMFEPDEITILCDDIEKLPDAINQFWKSL